MAWRWIFLALATGVLVAACADDDATPVALDAALNPSEVPRDSATGQVAGDGAAPAIDASTRDAGSVVGDAAAAAMDAGGSLAEAGSVLDAAATADAASGEGGAATAACDRVCLLGFMTGYINALVAKDPSKLKVSPTLKYTDNGVIAKLGEGLWATASMAVEGQRLDFADPQEGQVASQLVINENGTTPVIYMARLKVVAGEIAEIEAMTVRRQGARNGFFTPANMKPQPAFLQAVAPAMRMTRAEMKAEVDIYMDYLDGKVRGSALHLDAMCQRYENGARTANGTSSFTLSSWSFHTVRRYLIFDEEAGIVWGMFPFEATDTALVVGETFKVMNKKIMMIQAVMAEIPTKVWN